MSALEDGESTFSWHRRSEQRVRGQGLLRRGEGGRTALTWWWVVFGKRIGFGYSDHVHRSPSPSQNRSHQAGGWQQKRPQHRLRPCPGQAGTAPGSPPPYGRSSCPVTARIRLSTWFIHPTPAVPIWGRLSSLPEAFNVIILHKLPTVLPTAVLGSYKDTRYCR